MLNNEDIPLHIIYGYERSIGFYIKIQIRAIEFLVFNPASSCHDIIPLLILPVLCNNSSSLVVYKVVDPFRKKKGAENMAKKVWIGVAAGAVALTVIAG